MGIAKEGYRPDVDGLRGITILMGVGFHYFPENIPGGYVVVDSFFVISGYLITGIIRNGIEAGDFSFIDFYVRRIKRLFPALFLVLIFSFLVAWAGASADELREIGNYILSGAFFYANFTMAEKIDYFAKAAEYKPLLTLWSLSVEEQFYFIWPAILICLNKFRINLKFVTGLLILVFFFVAHQAYTSYLAQNYFYPHIRLWELLAGCYFAINSKAVEHLSFRLKTIFSVTGFILLITSMFTITRPEPLQLILPVAGTVLLILAGKDAWINRKFLSFPPLVTVGLMSYCIYLWHWPLLSFVRVIFGYQPDVIEKLGLIVLTFLVSYPSWRYLELPLRKSKQKIVPIALLAAVSIVGIVGYITSRTELIPPRSRVRNSDGKLALFYEKLAKDPFMNHHNALESVKAIRRGECHFLSKYGRFGYHSPKLRNCLKINSHLPNIFIVGDSYAADLYASLVRSHPQYNFLQMTGGGCSFRNNDIEDCKRMTELAVSFSETHQVDAVILAAGWNEKTYTVIGKLSERLLKANRKVIISGPIPAYKNVIPHVLEKNWKDEDLHSIVRENLRSEQFDLNSKMKTFAKDAGAAYIDRLQLYCRDSEYCEVLSEKGDLLLMDAAHLSVFGMDYLGKRMLEEKVLENILKK